MLDFWLHTIYYICVAKINILEGVDYILSPRTGRPTNEPKIHQARIRMSDEDIEMLEYCCKVTGLSKADVIRKGIKMVYEQTKEKL